MPQRHRKGKRAPRERAAPKRQKGRAGLVSRAVRRGELGQGAAVGNNEGAEVSSLEMHTKSRRPRGRTLRLKLEPRGITHDQQAPVEGARSSGTLQRARRSSRLAHSQDVEVPTLIASASARVAVSPGGGRCRHKGEDTVPKWAEGGLRVKEGAAHLKANGQGCGHGGEGVMPEAMANSHEKAVPSVLKKLGGAPPGAMVTSDSRGPIKYKITVPRQLFQVVQRLR
eukprot:7362474-Heterocapsa_arctica.AAC.1